jgi:hypothetical protein
LFDQWLILGCLWERRVGGIWWIYICTLNIEWPQRRKSAVPK